MRNLVFMCLCCCVVLYGCGYGGDINSGKTKVLVRVQAAYHKTIYLQREAFNDERSLKLDSGYVQSGLDTFTFYIPTGEERLYAITVGESNVRIPFITDTNNLEVYYNYATRRYNFKNSPASQQLKDFTDAQVQMSKTVRTLKVFVDSIRKKNPGYAALGDSAAKLDTMMGNFFARYKNFADTVHSPSAFLAVYDAIDFGADRAGLRAFIVASAARFPQHSVVQTLAKNVLDYVNVFEHPYKVGDTLSELNLPDEFGLSFSMSSLKGKYVLINIWSTFCDECGRYAEATKMAKQQFAAGKFEAVSIAVDDQKAAWQAIIQKNHYNWPQLIDEKMWAGPAFKALRFDSIPYNLLVAPDGRLIAKAIKADSILPVLRRNIK